MYKLQFAGGNKGITNENITFKTIAINAVRRGNIILYINIKISNKLMDALSILLLCVCCLTCVSCGLEGYFSIRERRRLAEFDNAVEE